MTTLIAKRAIKRTAGVVSVLLSARTRPADAATACVLVYHRVSPVRVTELRLDDWNVSPRLLDRHVASLAQTAEFAFVRDLPERLASDQPLARPLVCLTFDDGFQNFHDEVLPILRRYGAKATLFVVSAYIGASGPMPFDKWGVRHSTRIPAVAWRPIDWPSIERCVASGLVEIGGHSHVHANASHASPSEVTEEASRCRRLLTRRLGANSAVSYAYPYGSTRLGQVPPEYVSAVRDSGYSAAVTTDLGLADRRSNQFTLPRIEVYRSDSPAVVQAKLHGSLAPYRLTDKLRRARR